MATATNSRIFGVSHSGAINTIPGFTNSGRLHAADTQSTPQNNSYANVFWCNGVDELRFTWSIAYIIKDSEGNATVSTTVGVDPEPRDYVGEAGTAPAYIRFKGGSGNAAFIAACQHIVSLNEAAGYAYANPTPVGGTAAEWKTWMDANADYWTNFDPALATTTTTTDAPVNYFYWTYYECTNPSNVGTLQTEIAIAAGEAYDITTGAQSEGLVPSGIIVIQTQADASTPDIILGNPPTATCGETP